MKKITSWLVAGVLGVGLAGFATTPALADEPVVEETTVEETTPAEESEVPAKPAPSVYHGEWGVSGTNCDARTVEEGRYVWTHDWTLVDNVWVENATGTEDVEFRTRPATVEECGLIQVQGVPTIVNSPPTCERPNNTTVVTLPEGIKLSGGGNASGTIVWEEITTREVLVQHAYGKTITLDVLVQEGYTYDGPMTVSYTLSDPEDLGCPTPVVGTPSVTLTHPTCDVPKNTLDVVLPDGLDLSTGFKDDMSLVFEDRYSRDILVDYFYGKPVTLNVIVEPGFVYPADAPRSFSYTGVDPESLDCETEVPPTEEPSAEPTAAPAVLTTTPVEPTAEVASTNVAELSETGFEGYGLLAVAGGLLAVGVLSVAYARRIRAKK